MTNIAYYHTYLTDNQAVWSSIVLEQFKVIEDAGLIDHIDVMSITAISHGDDRLQRFVTLCESFGFKQLNIHFYNNPHKSDKDMLSGRETNTVGITEIPTFKRMWDRSQVEESNILYFHSKAMTAYDKFFGGEVYDIEKYKQNVYWRHYLNWGALEKWRECVGALDNHDMAGVNYSDNPIPHYSGSFWWAKSSHIKTLPDPETTDWWDRVQSTSTDQWLRTCPIRYKDEHWATHRPGIKMYNVKGADHNPAFITTPRKMYDRKPIFHHSV